MLEVWVIMGDYYPDASILGIVQTEQQVIDFFNNLGEYHLCAYATLWPTNGSSYKYDEAKRRTIKRDNSESQN